MRNKKRLNKVHYHIFSETVYSEDNGRYRTYGITAKEKILSKRISEQSVRDITSVRRKAKKMLRLLKKHQVSVYHFNDLIDDMLTVL